jgi:hypothetical protein
VLCSVCHPVAILLGPHKGLPTSAYVAIFGLANVCHRAVAGSVRCSATTLASIHWTQVAEGLPRPPKIKCLQTLPHVPCEGKTAYLGSTVLESVV